MTIVLNGTTGITTPGGTISGDALVNGLTVGKGGGSIGTNTAVGVSAGASNLTGIHITAVGYQAATSATGNNNDAFGFQSSYSLSSGTSNASFGSFAGYFVTTGTNNTYIGGSSGPNVNASTGSYNTGIGAQALTSITTASNNTAMGYQSLYSTATSSSTAIGFQAFYAGTGQGGGVAVGYQSGYNSAGFNHYFGYQAGYGGASYSGVNNNAMGYRALYSITSGGNNVAIGDQSLQSNTTASSNTAVGYQAGYGNVTGTELVAVGYQALKNNTGSANSASGYQALFFNTAGNNNTAFGDSALLNNTTASNNTAVGYQAGYSNTTGESVDAFGLQALYSNTTGVNNAAFGFYALRANTTGTRNAAFARGALAVNTTGSNNVSMGVSSMNNNTTGGNNVAIGDSALISNTTASNNTAVGYQAGYSGTTAGDSTYLGYLAGKSVTTAYGNLCVGAYAGRVVTTGTGNCIVGTQAGFSLTTGSKNTFIGSTDNATNFAAGYYVTTGSSNTIIGTYNGNQGGLDIRTASNYIVLSDGDGNPRGIFDGSGNLGLGVTPSAWSIGKALQVGSTTSLLNDGSLNTYFGNNFYYNGSFKYTFGSSYAAAYLTTSSGEHRWLTTQSTQGANNTISFTQAMTLDNSGNLGIGTTSPATYGKLAVNGTTYINGSLILTNTSMGNYSSTIQGAQTAAGTGNAFLFSDSSGVNLLTLAVGGKVGIGTTSPGFKVEVVAPYGTYNAAVTTQSDVGGGISITSTSNGTNSRVGLFFRGSDNIGSAIASAREDPGSTWRTYIAFYTNNSTGVSVTSLQEKMRLTSDGNLLISAGNLGIGQSAPVAKLHIGAETEANLTMQGLFVQGTKAQYASVNGLIQNQLCVYDDTASTAGSGGGISFGANTGSSQRTWLASIEARRDSATNDATNYAGSLVFYTRPAQSPTVERMRITSAGNVGINGTPTYKFDVGINNQTQSATVGSNGLIRNATGADQSPYTQARIIVYGGTSVDTGNWGYFAYGADANMRIVYGKIGSASGPSLIFGTTSAIDGTGAFSESMRIDGSGNLLVGKTTTSTGTQGVVLAAGTSSFANSSGTASINMNNIGFGGISMSFQYSGSQKGYIEITSTAVNYVTSSDQRLKTNIVDAPEGNIDSIKVRSFDWLEDGSHQTYGMVAQELLTSAPYAVSQSSNSEDMMGVDYSKLVPMLVKEIQSLRARVAQLETKGELK